MAPSEHPGSQSASRKSSLGANSRRGPQKAHIPYRGDDLQHGKKTGKTVDQVSRDADDFEPFDQVLDQAYKGGNVPRPANNRSKAVNGKSRPGPSPVQEDYDESGELSMDIDSTHNSPSTYFNTTTAPQPSSAKRAGSSSRPLPRGSNVDYDRVPSPKPAPRRNSAQSRAGTQPLHPSRLRNEVQDDDDTIRGVNADNDDDPFASAGVDDGEGGDYPGDYDFPGNDELSLNSRGNMSFTELAQNDEEESVAEDDQSPILPRIDKGKRRAEVQEEPGEEEDVGIEDDIAAGLQEVEEERYDDEYEEDSGHSNKKHRRDEDHEDPSPSEPPKKPPKKTKHKWTKTQARMSMYETLDEDGLRRSKRRHYPPLEYWRQEKVVWGRREHGRSVVPVIKEIITIPKPPPEPLGAKKRKRGSTRAPRSKSKSLGDPDLPVEEVQIIEIENPELGWDDQTDPHGIVIDWYSKNEVERRVAFTSKMVNPKVAINSKYMFQKIFGDGDFIAAGQLIIPPGEKKPAKPTKDNTYIFYLIEGAVQFKVHRSSFILATGGMFMVPRGNQYYIENICQRDAKLFFAQARKIPEGEDEGAPDIKSRTSAPPRARTAPRSSSYGAPSPKQPASASAAKELARVRSQKD